MTRISAMVLTRNAEKELPTCLESLRWVDEIVVLDDGSTDRTQEVARRFNAQVFTRRLDNFSAQRNAALAHCTGEWVLVVDADEWLPVELQQEIQQLLQRPVAECAFRMPRKNLFLGRWIRGCSWYPNYVLRLFRREGVSYSGMVHEGPDLPGKPGTLSNALWHHAYDTLEQFLEKQNRYSTLAAAEMLQAGKRASALDLLGQPLFAFLKHYILKKGFRDGVDGLVVSTISTVYVFLKYAKLYYLGKQRSAGQTPAGE